MLHLDFNKAHASSSNYSLVFERIQRLEQQAGPTCNLVRVALSSIIRTIIMVPKVAGRGRSFLGAGAYYLHDKKAETSERVAFAETINLPTNDPEKAIRMMAYTAMHQDEIKARAGGSTRGRKLTEPVYSYSLSWAPGEQPTREEMVAAAKETLKVLGLEKNETLLVCHNDEPHPHIHVIVNRVNPETGIAAPLKMDHLKLSTWAEGYEKRQGLIRCEQRVANNALRRKGEFVKDWVSQRASEFHRWAWESTNRQADRRIREDERLGNKHSSERDQLRRDRDRLVSQQRQRFRDGTRADWRDLFTIQRQEQRRLRDAQRNAWSRMRFFIATHGPEFREATKAGRRSMLRGAVSAITGSRKQLAILEEKQKKERIFFARKLRERAERATATIREKHERQLKELQRRQDQERREMRAKQAKESQAQAREIRDGKDKELFKKEQRGRLRQELKENQADIAGPPRAPRKPTLSDRFQTARGESGQRTGKDKEQPSAGKGLTDRFNKARGSDALKDKSSRFKENEEDIGRKKGKGRGEDD
ncbi:hypothetical protein ABIF72_003951 [Bradyrhizobium japonicum]